jgi:2-phosphosulfolactate phosphatase
MRIQVLHLIEGAARAEGLAVVIDVFRAFSVAPYVMAGGAKKIIPVADIETAYRLKEAHPDYLLMGERDGRIQPGFDYGNSPYAVRRVDFTGRTVVQTTSAGTRGIEAALGRAEQVLTGSFVNAGAILRYIRREDPQVLSLACMGVYGRSRGEEDEACADYLISRLEGRAYDFAATVEALRQGRGRQFFDPALASAFPPGDFDLSLDLDRFDFVLKVVHDRQDGLPYLRRIDI